MTKPIMEPSPALPNPASRSWLIAECLALSVGVPLAIVALQQASALFLILWVITLLCIFVLKRRCRGGFSVREMVAWKPIPRKLALFLLGRWMLATMVMAIVTYWNWPERWLDLPTNRPNLWIMIMLLYPLLSAFPQEIIFRVYFFQRFKPLFPSLSGMMLASGLFFGFAHIIMENYIAVSLSVIGGLFFADTYARTKSFLIVWIEHAFYGCALFTTGLGWFFYHGSVQVASHAAN